MIVYGDATAHESLRAKQGTVGALLDASAVAPTGIERHGRLVAALIEAGELAQALLDLRFEARGTDADEAVETALGRALLRMAGAVGRSWEDAFAAGDIAALAAAVAALPVPDAVVAVRHPEGFAHYALYPEAFWSTARRFGPQPGAAVIGLRSIGTTLAACVAAGLGAEAAVTLRPVGHPFRRGLRVAPALAARWAARPDRLHAVVDEGPGLSGSSFGAVADLLGALNVPPDTIAFFPGHGGDLGAEADPAHRARWRVARRASLGFDELTGQQAAPHQRLEAWTRDLTGPSTAPPLDLSGGGWRAHLLADQAAWPPVDPQNEKRKILLRTARGAVLLRFVGLGRRGAAKAAMAEKLGAAALGVPPLGWRHGFLVEPWLSDGRPLRAESAGDRMAVLAHLPSYLAFRALRFPALGAGGASPAALHAMARANIAEGLGEAEARVLDRWTPAALDRLAASGRPVLIDGRLHPWEWLARPGAAPLKTDALDHHAAHDLVGAQDIAWDLAGAYVEWNLSAAEAEALRAETEGRMGRRVDPDLLALFAFAYPAFQLGAFVMAEGRAEETERHRLRAQSARYRAAIRRAICSS